MPKCIIAIKEMYNNGAKALNYYFNKTQCKNKCVYNKLITRIIFSK